MFNSSLVGVGWSAHVLNNCIHHGAKGMNIDIKNNINKLSQYFSVYTVRTEELKILNTRDFSPIARLAGSPCFLDFQDF